MYLKSDGIVNGIIDVKYGKYGKLSEAGIPRTSFPLNWGGCTEIPKAYAITFIDYDNCSDEGYPWVHWSVANIPGEICELSENASDHMGEIHAHIKQGKNSWVSELAEDHPDCNKYGGPAPEKFPHEYEIRVYALKEYLNLENGFYQSDFRKEVESKAMDEAVLYGTYLI